MHVRRTAASLTGFVLLVLVTAGCQPASFVDEMAASGPVEQAADPGAPAGDAGAAPTTAAAPQAAYTPTVCSSLGALKTGLESLTADLDANEGASTADVVAQLLPVIDGMAAEIGQVKAALEAAAEPTFDDGAAFAARAEAALAQVESAINGISQSIGALDPASADYDAEVVGQVMGLAFASFPLVYIFIDEDTVANSTGMTPAQMLAASPGSLGFYREARDDPNCAVFFEDYDRAELDALLGPGD